MSHFLNSSTHYNCKDGDQPSRESSSSTPPLQGHHYEVFLSFRGETRRGFTDHLYKRLFNAGISVFRDKEGLPVGERNWPELLKAIEASKISIPIISPDYASSEWCLNELVHILKCKETFGQHVIPIFYRVKPSDVRKSLDVSEEESQVSKKRRLNFDGTHVQEWKDALTKVSYMTGLESEKVADGHEGELVEIVVAEVLEALKKHALVVGDDLVGVEDHVKKIMNMVNVEGSNDVSAILIHGMGGIGKTTLAKVLYNRLAHQFDCCSFLANIREIWSQHNGKVNLQEQLILDILGKGQSISRVDEGVKIIRDRFKHKKVLILLDDVDCRDQLNALAGKPDWFGRGSMLIVTSRINNVLKEWEGIINYELNGLKDDQSFLLFCKHAFKRSHSIPNEFQSIAKEIVSTTGGLPLAIEVIGCLLYNEDRSIWEEKLKELREIPDDEVQSKLKISFHALKPEEQDIFLDIACHPWIRKTRKYARHMWDSYGYRSELKIRKLVSMSLVKIGEKEELIIHDQLRDLGREIVRQESRDNLGKRSRLWKEDEALEVLESEQGTQKIQTLGLEGIKLEQVRCTSKQFKRMTKLRYLHMCAVNLEGDFENLFQNLRWLEWRYGKLDFMGSNFMPKKLVVLELFCSNITEQWIGWSQMKHLRVLKLQDCFELTALPDISALKQLEVLILSGCSKLRNIHPSIRMLSKLQELDLSYCIELEWQPNLPSSLTSLKFTGDIMETLPDFSNLTNLEHLEFTHDFRRRDTTLDFRNLNRITTLHLGSNSVHTDSSNSEYYGWDLLMRGSDKEFESVHIKLLLELPSTLVELEIKHSYTLRTLPNFSDLKNLTILSIENCPELIKIDGLDGAESLTSVMICKCKKLSNLGGMGISVTDLELEDLDSLVSLPNLSTAKKLKNLKIRNCGDLIEIQGLDNAKGIESVVSDGCSSLERIGDLCNLESLDLSETPIRCLPTSIRMLSKLQKLNLLKCNELEWLPNLPSSLTSLKFTGDSIKTLSDFSNLTNLEHLKFRHDFRRQDTTLNFRNLNRITTLHLGNNGVHAYSSNTKYHGWCLSTDEGFESLHTNLLLGLPSTLVKLELNDCHTLRTLPNFSDLKNLTTLSIKNCPELMKIDGLDGAESLTSVKIGECKKLSRLSGMGISVTHLELEDLDSLVSLPNLSTAKELKYLKIRNCRNLIEIQGFNNAKGIESVVSDGCSSLERIGDLCNLESLDSSETPIRIGKRWVLSKLQELDLSECNELEWLPNLPSSLTSLKFTGDLMETLPDFSNLTNLEHLEFTHDFRRRDTTLNFRNLNRITTLHLGNNGVHAYSSNTKYFVWDFLTDGSDKEFESVHINLRLQLPSTLVKLELNDFHTLGTLPNFSDLENLTILSIKNWPELIKIDGLDEAESLTSVMICKCKKLSNLGGMGISVTHLELQDLDSLVSLPNLSTAKKLKDLKIRRCRYLVEIQGLDSMEGIESIILDRCSSLERISDLSHMKMLTTLKVSYCEKLREITGLGISLMNLTLEHLDSLVSLSDLLSTKKLKGWEIRSCRNLVLKFEEICGISMRCTAFGRFPDHQNVSIQKLK